VTQYSTVLGIHSWLRWVTLLLAIGATLNALRGDTDISLRPPGRHWDTFFMMALDIQVLFGLLLYFGLSPFTRRALTDLGAAMRDPGLRFWTFEHIGAMLTAVVLVRIGRVQALTAKTPVARRRKRLVFFGLTTLAIIAGIPWPGLPNGRPLFRL
jgi:hypothetical protein